MKRGYSRDLQAEQRDAGRTGCDCSTSGLGQPVKGLLQWMPQAQPQAGLPPGRGATLRWNCSMERLDQHRRRDGALRAMLYELPALHPIAIETANASKNMPAGQEPANALPIPRTPNPPPRPNAGRPAPGTGL